MDGLPVAGPGQGGPGPARLGLRWPAEWEPHAATWLSWPHNPETWPAGLAPVEEAFDRMVEALVPGEDVHISVSNEAMAERVAARLDRLGSTAERRTTLHQIPTDDAWVRDHGPVFLVADDGSRALLDFRFDAWGGKYPPWDRDDAVPAAVAARLALPRFRVDAVLEGGSVDGDGRGTVLTTEACLLHGNRGPGRTREAMEELLARTLGARQVVWLGDGVEGDDTDGHIDDLARFVAPGRVVCAVEADAADPNAAPLADNHERLRRARDAEGRLLEVVELPMPAPMHAGGARCPASYANFYVANACVLVPVFGDASDARAVAILAECFADRQVVGIPCREVVAGLGAVHCLTQQEPAAPGVGQD